MIDLVQELPDMNLPPNEYASIMSLLRWVLPLDL